MRANTCTQLSEQDDVTYLVVDLARGCGGIAEVFWVAVRGVQAAAGRNAIGWVIHTAKPTGVVIHATTTQLGSQREKQRALRDEECNTKLVLFSP